MSKHTPRKKSLGVSRRKASGSVPSELASLGSAKKREPASGRSPGTSRATAQARRLSGKFCEVLGHEYATKVSENGTHQYCRHCGRLRPADAFMFDQTTLHQTPAYWMERIGNSLYEKARWVKGVALGDRFRQYVGCDAAQARKWLERGDFDGTVEQFVRICIWFGMRPSVEPAMPFFPALGIGAKPTKEAVPALRRTVAKRSGAKPGRGSAKATPKPH